MSKIQILVGSINGRATQTANAVAHVLDSQDHDIRINNYPEINDLQQDKEEALLICCSTTGDGELPGNFYKIFNALDDQAISLNGREYGVIALGDSGYRYFAQAGYMMEHALYLCGATRVGSICTLDAKEVENHPLAASLWANEWVTNLSA